MGLFDKLFPGKKKEPEAAVSEYFKMLNGYTPAFTSFEGGLYEMELTRSCVHTFATHCSKLKPTIVDDPAFERKMQVRPNPYMDTVKYLYRLATILAVHNTAFIAPLFARDFRTVTGFFPLLPSAVELREYNGVVYLVYKFGGGDAAAVELEKSGIMTQYLFRDDFFGETNQALDTTMALMHAQSEGLIEGIKSSASIRFLARMGVAMHPEDLEKERRRFIETNLSPGTGGVMMFDTKFADVHQITSNPWTVNPRQMGMIEENVYTYFGTNPKILQNNFTSQEWLAYYEGKIVPFAMQAALVHTQMKYSQDEIMRGKEILLTAKRTDYLANEEKLALATSMFDRAMMSQDEAREIFNMKPLNTEESKKYYIRREYAEISALDGPLLYEGVVVDGDKVETE